MREGILGQLPATLPKDKTVLVIGHDNVPSESLKRLISDLNRGDKWIRPEFRGTMTGVKVTSQTTVVLTMFGVNHGTIARIRKEAENEKVWCPNHAFTASEVKNILNALHRIRNGMPPSEDIEIASPNGSAKNGNYAQAVDYEETSSEPEGQNVSPNNEVASGQPAYNSAEAESALAALDKFSGIFEETQLAVLVVADQLKAAVAECDSLRTQLAEKGKKVEELNKLLANANKIAHTCGPLEDENKKLKGEIARLQKTLGSLGDLIKGAQDK